MARQVYDAPYLRPHLVSPVNFLFATRDTGYKTTSLAVAELIDNSLQAGSQHINVELLPDSGRSGQIEIRVVDDGEGMDAENLAEALTFGGTRRFNDRSSLGRYGMGLPNGALSRCRRVEVYAWQGSDVLFARLDIDELLELGEAVLPAVEVVERPSFVPDSPSGTVVWMRRCDRLEYKRSSALARRLGDDLGRIYRRFLVRGVNLHVNGVLVAPDDPLRLHSASRITGATSMP